MKACVDSQELALDVAELVKGNGALPAQEAEHFRVMVIGLNEKLKVLELCQQKMESLRSKLKKAVVAREHLPSFLVVSDDCWRPKFGNFYLTPGFPSECLTTAAVKEQH